MENVYRTKSILHIKSLRFVLIGSALSFLIFYLILTSQKEEFNLRAFMFGALPIFLIFFTPALYLHMTYYFKNFGQKIIVDESQSRLTVVKYGKQFTYSYSNIISVEQHLGIFYRNRIDRVGRRLAPWTPYGYIEIKLDNGLRFQMTSLMVDIHTDQQLKEKIMNAKTYNKASVEASKQLLNNRKAK